VPRPPLSYSCHLIKWTYAEPWQFARPLHCEGHMELALVIVVVVVAGALIPGNPKIRFYR